MIRIQEIKLTLDETLDDLPKKIIKKLRISKEDLISWRVVKESLDARKIADIHFTYCIDCKVKQEEQVLRHNPKITRVKEYHYTYPEPGKKQLIHRPVVVGFGPAGMFAALILAQMGYCPLVIERGECVEQRVKSVEEFWQSGKLNPCSNVQFGEGGAGTFSDGKLTARSKDLRVHKVLEELVHFGAPKDILYMAHPHIGTDLLRDIVKQLREEIISLGGEVRFQSQLTDLKIKDGKLCGIVVNGNEEIKTDQVILAIGHSARDTYRFLYEKGIAMEAKAFAIGARIEHPQSLINKAQFKQFANHPRLSAAEYRLTHSARNGRGVYTFCMCPGGTVVPSSSIEGGVVVNGMSEHARDKENANSALLVQVRPEDFGEHPMDGIAYQEELERKAFQLGGGNYKAPAQLVKDFLNHQPSIAMGKVKPSYALGVTPCDLHEILPKYITSAMEEAIIALDHKLKGFAYDDAVLTGVETRSSSPIRINRTKDNLQSINLEGLYPCGEGAGFAGGIVSAAIDGIRCAEQIIQEFSFEKISKL